MITKEICRDYALKIKEETGKFPTQKDWVVKNGYPTSRRTIIQLFESYNRFRDYCEEPELRRTKEPTILWIKSCCTIDDNNCWNWSKALHDSGYGVLRYNNTNYRVHRLSYELTNGSIAKELVIRHKCANKQCCNPDHLETGTLSQNGIDCRSYSKNTKLTIEQVIELKIVIKNTTFLKHGDKLKFEQYWADKFKVSINTINFIRLNKTWKDIIV